MRELAQRMHRLFAGYDDAHGTYAREEHNPDKNKLEIKASAKTLRGPVSDGLWVEHLSGQSPIGIIPIDARNQCVWGCIDIDKYDVDPAKLLADIKRYSLPLLVCRSKSGGAHVFLFTQEPVPAGDMIAKLQSCAAMLGHGHSEIFPKQAAVMLDRGDLGSWLNMPYYGGDSTSRYCYTEQGRGMTLAQFLDAAEATRIPRSRLNGIAVPSTRGRKTDPSLTGEDDSYAGPGDLEGAPPCLQILAQGGFPEGTRNSGLVAAGIYCKKRWPATWQEKLEEFNREHMEPPLPSEEVAEVIKNLSRKDYNYGCSQHPLVAHCNSAVCRTRQYGVGRGGVRGMPSITNLRVLDSDQPVWFLNIENVVLELTTEQLFHYHRFQQVVLERAHVVLPTIKRSDWEAVLAGLMEDLVTIEASEDVGLSGQFLELLQMFLTERNRAHERDEIPLGKPWLDDDTQQFYFRLVDLQAHLELHRFRTFTRTQMVSRLSELGGGPKFFKIKGRGVNTWWVPHNFAAQQESYDVPQVAAEVI